MNKTIKWAFLLAVVILSSCATRKDFVYLQDMDELQEYPMIQKYEAIIHRDDRLSIIVNSKNPELSLPFNMSGSRSYSVGVDGTISNNEVGIISDDKEKGYLVDINGNIDRSNFCSCIIKYFNPLEDLHNTLHLFFSKQTVQSFTKSCLGKRYKHKSSRQTSGF